jgi:peptide/nickel transport system permease protein
LAPRRRRTVRRSIVVPVAILAIVALMGIVGPFLSGFDPLDTHPRDRLLPPGSLLQDGGRAWLGTDSSGRDMLGLILAGARVSVGVGVATIVVAGLIGCLIGMTAGFWRGWLDSFMMRLADIQLAFPSLLLAIFLAATLGASILNVIIVLALTRWVIFARTARAQTLQVSKREFVESTRALGGSSLHVLRRCVVPALVSTVLVVATLELGLVIIAEASLSFLGLGTPPTTPSWGATIALGRNHLATAWWISAFPGLVLALTVISVGLLGDRLRDRLDPYQKALTRS